MHALLPDDGEVGGPARADAAHRCAPRRAHRPGRRADPARRAGSRRCGTAALIAEGVALISATLSRGAVGAYQLQAAIAAVHDEAARAEDTDWPQILALYGLLERMSDNPMVALNRAIAVGDGARAARGLELLATLAGDRASARPLPARRRARAPARNGRRRRRRRRRTIAPPRAAPRAFPSATT